MKRYLLLGYFLLTLSVCFGADQRGSDLKSLYDSRQWFKLREAVASNKKLAFYQGAVACAFNDTRRAEKYLQQVFKATPRSEEAFEAHGLLAYLYERKGNYRQVYAHLQAMQAAKPDFAGLKSAAALLAALSHYPGPSIAARRSSEVRLSEDLFIPVSVNGTPANYGFDSGLNISVISDAEAKRLNLAIHDAMGSEFVDGASGHKMGVRFAIADQVVVGSFQLRHVVFTVVNNDSMPFVELPADKQGILGLPVLLAFGTVRWSRSGTFQVGLPSAPRAAWRSNLCFEGATPVVEGLFHQNLINVWLDTGSGNSYLTQRFVKDFPGVASEAGKRESTLLRGLGGTSEVQVISLPEFKFAVGGYDFVLRPAQILPMDEKVDRDWYDVWLGMDLLSQANRVTLDFNSMSVVIE